MVARRHCHKGNAARSFDRVDLSLQRGPQSFAASPCRSGRAQRIANAHRRPSIREVLLARRRITVDSQPIAIPLRATPLLLTVDSKTDAGGPWTIRRSYLTPWASQGEVLEGTLRLSTIDNSALVTSLGGPLRAEQRFHGAAGVSLRRASASLSQSLP